MMYLLLRDNKQSGPYSLDELKVKGLKAYDLVWVEGRSAAWRYPSEIGELSAFAPAVEEQPFDRFYKKPAAVKEASVPVTVSSPTSTRRTIYVTMPGGISARENARETAPVRENAPVRESAALRETAPVRDNAPARESVSGRESGPAREVVRETAPLREAASIRERVTYVPEPMAEILPPFPKRKAGKIWVPLAVGGSVVALLAAGIFIGLSIQKNSSEPLKLASKDKAQDIVRTTAQPLPVSPANNSVAGTNSAAIGGVATVANSSKLQTDPAAGPQGPKLDAADTKPVTKQRPATQKPKMEAPKTQAAYISPATDSPTTQQAPRREAMHRSDVVQSQPADEHEMAKAALAREISVGTNKYEVGTFGGIRNLQVTVTNRSAYSLDQVVVTVSYIQANKKTYKTENLYFHGIGPGSALMLEAPKSSRGVSIQYKVSSVSSKELGLGEPGT